MDWTKKAIIFHLEGASQLFCSTLDSKSKEMDPTCKEMHSRELDFFGHKGGAVNVSTLLDESQPSKLELLNLLGISPSLVHEVHGFCRDSRSHGAFIRS
jgi:hypothetical protein